MEIIIVLCRVGFDDLGIITGREAVEEERRDKMPTLEES